MNCLDTVHWRSRRSGSLDFNKIIHGNCLDVMKDMPDNCIDTVITDPPYGLKFMGKDWDHGIPGIYFWSEMLRVAKPGAICLAFGGTRTYHRLVCAIEDAGWEIRDCIMWVYGTGFPKSLDISKAIDKAAGAKRETIQSKWAERYPHGPGGNQFSVGNNPDGTRVGLPTDTAPSTDAAKLWDGWGTALKPAYEPICVAMKPLDGTFAQNALKHGVAGLNVDGGRIKTNNAKGNRESWEEQRNREFIRVAIVVLSEAQEELERCQSFAVEGAELTTNAKDEIKPVDINKMDIGCSDGMRMDATSISLSTGEFGKMPTAQSQQDIASIIATATGATIDWTTWNSCQSQNISPITKENIIVALKSLQHVQGRHRTTVPAGRWPSNVIHDSSEEVVGLFPATKDGSAARFFYCAKASKKERNEGCEKLPLSKSPGVLKMRQDGSLDGKPTLPRQNNHPTVKPLALMEYLCHLTATPTGGIVLDPFLGSGTTAIAARRSGRDFIGIDIDQGYCQIAEQRLMAEKSPK